MQTPPPPSVPAHVIVEPRMVKRPDGADLGAYYPDAALRLGVTGFAVLRCGVAADGRLSGCEVLQEAPAGLGFGDAVLKLSTRFQMTPQTRDGVPTADGREIMAINFSLPPSARPPMRATLLRELKPGEPAPTASTVKCAGDDGPLCVARPFTWASAPQASSLVGLYGAVAMRCRVKADGGLEACEAAAASPGAHVDAAAYWGRRHRAPTEVEGRPTAGAVVRFVVLPSGGPPPAASPPVAEGATAGAGRATPAGHP